MENRAKSILISNKPNSKERRISWGKIQVKEYGQHDEVDSQPGDEYNITIADIHQNNTILEESLIEDSFISKEIITQNKNRI